MRNKMFKCYKLLLFFFKSGLHGEKRKKLLEIINDFEQFSTFFTMLTFFLNSKSLEL